MNLKNILLNYAQALLRVPSLFVLDELCRHGLSHIFFESKLCSGKFDSPFHTFLAHRNLTYCQQEDDNLVLINTFINLANGMIAILMFILNKNHALNLCFYIISWVIVFISYLKNIEYIEHLQMSALKVEGNEQPSISISSNSLQFTCATFFCLWNVEVSKHLMSAFLVYLCFMNVNFSVYIFPASPGMMDLISQVSVSALSAYLLFYACSSLIKIGKFLIDNYLFIFTHIGVVGLLEFLSILWSRLQIKTVLKLFWCTKFITHLWIILYRDFSSNADLQVFELSYVYDVWKELMINGCDTYIILMGLTSVVSQFSKYIARMFRWMMDVDENYDRGIDDMSATLFFILALQTGLVSMPAEKRFVRLCHNFYLLFTAILHVIHNAVDTLLMSLSTSKNPNLLKHARALLVCGILVSTSFTLLIHLCHSYSFSTWLLAVIVFFTEIIIKVTVSLLVYVLLLLDAHYSDLCDNLSDYVYYIRAFGNTVDFIFAIILCLNGGWIFFFESGGLIRGMMMMVHAYFNIWCEAKKGWKSIVRRRTAVHKLEKLLDASPEQIQKFDDVCAICLQNLNSAKITLCNHYFHGTCLRSWLYIQDICPLCHQPLFEANSGKLSNDQTQSPVNEAR